MLSLFLEIMRSPKGCPNKVHIQILQTLGILCQSVRNETSLYYLLSNNYINECLSFNFDFADDELLDQFVSFLKSLSLRLNIQTIQFFFIEEFLTIPLLTRAIDLLRFREAMVRVAAQTTILNVFRVKDKRAREISLQDDILHHLFSQISIILEVHYSSALLCCLEHTAYANHPSMQDKGENKVGRRLEEQLSDILTGLEDWLFYLQDIFSLKIRRLRKFLVRYLISNFVYTVLLDPFLRYLGETGGVARSSPRYVLLLFQYQLSIFYIDF